jgi:hypothetical protein
MISGENIDIYKSQSYGVGTCHNQRQINSVIVSLLLLPSAELTLFCLRAPLHLYYGLLPASPESGLVDLHIGRAPTNGS